MRDQVGEAGKRAGPGMPCRALHTLAAAAGVLLRALPDLRLFIRQLNCFVVCCIRSLQEATTRRLLTHCGIPWQDAVLHFHETQRTVATASLAQVGGWVQVRFSHCDAARLCWWLCCMALA